MESIHQAYNSLPTSSTITLVAILTVLIWYYFNWSEKSLQQYFKQRNIQYISLGNMFIDILLRRRIEIKKDELIKKFGTIFGFYMVGKPTILVAEPELIQQVVAKDFTTFNNRRKIPSADPVLSKVLPNARDETWKRLRSVITPALSAGKLRNMKFCIDETIETLMINMNNAVDKSEIIDIKNIVGAFTMDTIVQIAFGIKIDSLVEIDNPIIHHAKMLFSTNFTFRNLVAITLTFASPKLASLLDVRINRVPIEFFHKMALEIIKQKRSELHDKTKIKGTNFIECLLQAEVENDEIQADKTKQVTNDELIAQCVMFFVVGYDTTATTITMVSYHLALYPKVQERLYREIISMISKLKEENTNEDDPIKLITYESLNHFEYLNAVIKETLRLYTPLIFAERDASTDFQLETSDGKLRVDVKQGDIIHIPAWSVHRDPKQYPDPEKFDPERFLTPNPTFHKYAYMPFGNGPRACVAKNLALLEARLSIIHMIRKYQFYRCPQTKVPVELYYQSNFIIARDVIIGARRRT
ncbi:Thromboxane-A synthase [Blomia tropicalis]|nr:Thromboxane-A synthase [Blomia tropicalis]